MYTDEQTLWPFLLILGAVASGCAPVDDPADDRSADMTGEDGDIGEASDAISHSELSVLLMGGSFTVKQGYAPNGVHAGIDFSGTDDGVTSVRSPVNGTIVANTSACGKVAIFDGKNTLIFAHMTQRTGLGVGSYVNVGTYLGKASQVVGGGCTATGPHLHIEIRTGQNTYMANPSANNTATTLDPLTYQYGPFPAVTLVSASKSSSFQWLPIQGASKYRLQVAGPSGFSGDTCAGGTCIFESTTSGTSLSGPVLGGGTYSWRVRAGSSYSGGLWSTPQKL